MIQKQTSEWRTLHKTIKTNQTTQEMPSLLSHVPNHNYKEMRSLNYIHPEALKLKCIPKQSTSESKNRGKYRVHLLKERLKKSPSQKFISFIKKSNQFEHDANDDDNEENNAIYPLSIFLDNKIELLDEKIKQLSNQSKRMQDLIVKATKKSMRQYYCNQSMNMNDIGHCNDNDTNEEDLINEYKGKGTVDEKGNRSKRNVFKLPPINSKPSPSLYDFSNCIDNIKVNSIKNNEDTDLVDKEIDRIKEEFEKKSKRIILKQRLELDSLDYIMSKFGR